MDSVTVASLETALQQAKEIQGMMWGLTGHVSGLFNELGLDYPDLYGMSKDQVDKAFFHDLDQAIADSGRMMDAVERVLFAKSQNN